MLCSSEPTVVSLSFWPNYLICLFKGQCPTSVTPSRSRSGLVPAGIRDSDPPGHTLTWPLPRHPAEWSRKPWPPAPVGNDGSRGASRSPSPTPAWRWPSASFKTEVQMKRPQIERTSQLNRTSFTCCGSGKLLGCPPLLWRRWWAEGWPSQSPGPRPPPRPPGAWPESRDEGFTTVAILRCTAIVSQAPTCKGRGQTSSRTTFPVTAGNSRNWCLSFGFRRRLVTYIDGGLNAALHARAFNSHMRLGAQQLLHLLSLLLWLHLPGYFQLEFGPQLFGQRQAFRKQI